MVKNEIIEKPDDIITISRKLRFNLINESSKYAVINISTFNNASREMYLGSSFKNGDYLIKSLTAMYIEAKTPRRDKTIVKTGVCQPVSLSSFTPPQTATRIIPNI